MSKKKRKANLPRVSSPAARPLAAEVAAPAPIQQTTGRRFRPSPAVVAGIFVAAIFLLTLYIRIYLPYDRVFADGSIRLVGADSYYHVRLVENLLGNSFQRITFDPYTFFPHGATVSWPLFFDWLLAAVIWLVTLGSPSQQAINVISACYPAVLAAFIVIPVYFIGKLLFNRWVGVIAAGVIAVLPSGLFVRSRLGALDHHVAESLFVAVIVLFLLLAIKAAKSKEITFGHLWRRDWQAVRRPLLWSALAGVFIALYMLTWVAGIFFIFCLFLIFIILSVINHMRGVSNDYIAVIAFVALSVGTVRR